MASQSASANHIVAFFGAYRSFEYDPNAPSAASEFNRLCQHMRWERGGLDQKKAWKDFQVALAKQFNKLYGTDADNLKAWQRLCSTLKIEPVPESLREARRAVLNIHANPVDLIEGFKGSKEIKTFESESELAGYSGKFRKIMYPSTPGAGALLQMLLNPRDLTLKGLERSEFEATESSQPKEVNPILSFFERYPTFTYNHAAPSAASEFRRLCEHKGWEKGNTDQKVAWRDFQDALAKQFNSLYGVKVDNLRLWQRVCSTLKIEPLPENLEAAQEAVFKTHFNLVDLIEGYKGAREIKTFESDIELAEYSRRSGKIISESSPAAGAFLQAIMRHQVHGPLNRPLKPHQLGRNAVSRDKGGRGGKDLNKKAARGRGGQGRGSGPGRVAEPEEEDGTKRKREGARGATRKQLVQCSVERSGAFLDYDEYE